MRRVPLSALVASGVVSIGWLAGPSAFAQATEQAPTLTLEIVGGQVTLEAHNVTARRILEEWARVGGTTIVNADQLPDDRISLELRGVPEAKAFALLLRSAAGYVAVRRRQASTAGSQFDRIFVLGGPSAEKLFEVSSAEIEGVGAGRVRCATGADRVESVPRRAVCFPRRWGRRDREPVAGRNSRYPRRAGVTGICRFRSVVFRRRTRDDVRAGCARALPIRATAGDTRPGAQLRSAGRSADGATPVEPRPTGSTTRCA